MPDASRPAAPPRRKGAVRMSEIPPRVLRDLEAGREETVTLVEWLAIDIRRLARAAISPLGLGRAGLSILAASRELAAARATSRTRGMGEAIHRALKDHPRRESVMERLATHRSDMVRAWIAYAAACGDGRSFASRLESARRFAADGSVAVRECAWGTFRPHLAADLARGLELLGAWVRDEDPNIRRCAVEATRPRGVWTRHIEALKSDPRPGERLLAPVRSDPSDYVRTAVANWINDASKTRPEWAKALCARWSRESPTRETAWIVHHALRTLRRQAGDGPGARRRALRHSAAAPSLKGRPAS